MTQELLNLDDVLPVEVPVQYGGKAYLLKEATGDASCRWRNAALKTAKLGPDGKPVSLEGVADLDPLLVSLCLFEPDGKPVPLPVIRSWPARVQKRLYEKAKSISQLGDAGDGDGADTAEGLETKIAELREKLNRLEDIKAGNGHISSQSALGERAKN